MAEKSNVEVASPCIRVCTLDDNDVCLGCGRTLNEIVHWTQVDDAERRAIVARSEQRRKQRPDFL